MNQPITNEEIAAHVSGIADRQTSRRVLRAALMQPAVRERLALLADADEASKTIVDPDPSFDDRAAQLKVSLRNITLVVAGEVSEAANTRRAAPAAQPDTKATPGPLLAAGRILTIGRLLLTLPCLAPATASSSPDTQMHRQTVQTSDGVRIEFQQLPGGPPYRLRIVVDASLIRNSSSEDELSMPLASAYNIAYLTIEDNRGPDTVTSLSSDTHVLVVPLNTEGRGFADFVIGGGTGPRQLPAPAGACRLVSATLSYLPSDQGPSA